MIVQPYQIFPALANIMGTNYRVQRILSVRLRIESHHIPVLQKHNGTKCAKMQETHILVPDTIIFSWFQLSKHGNQHSQDCIQSTSQERAHPRGSDACMSLWDTCATEFSSFCVLFQVRILAVLRCEVMPYQPSVRRLTTWHASKDWFYLSEAVTYLHQASPWLDMHIPP